MMKQFLLLLISFSFYAAFGQMKVPDNDRIKQYSIASKALGRVKKFLVIEPTDYNTSTAYPVMFLLHSLSKRKDSCEFLWVGNTAIVKNTEDIPFLIVTPALDSVFITNGAKENTENFFINELCEFVFTNYKVDRSKLAVAGASNGGLNSLLAGLRYPDMFRFVGDINGAIIIPRMLDVFQGHPRYEFAYAPSVHSFGNAGNPNRKEYDVFELVKQSDTSKASYIFMMAGIQDAFTDFLPYHRELAALMAAKGLKYEYHEVRGRHSWRDWDWEVMEVIRSMRKLLNF
jgi:enterochelin esterase-like enzyme